MQILIIVAAAVGLAFGTGCKKDKKTRAVSEDEISNALAAHAQRVKAHVAKPCKREVLRGEVRAGSGSKAVLAFGDPNGAHAACFKAVEALDLYTTLHDKCAENVNGCPARALADPVKKEGIDAALASCAGLLTAVTAAVSHGDVCSPYRADGPRDPVLLGLLRASGAAAVQARKLARDGEALAGLERIFDALRLNQDVARGGASILAAMISAGADNPPMLAAEAILNAKIAWTNEQLDAAVAQSDKLIKTQFSFGETLIGESLHMAEGVAGLLRKNAGKSDERDQLGVTWLATAENNAESEKACVGQSLKACVERSERLTKPTSDDHDGTISTTRTSGTRAERVAALRSLMAIAVWKYARKHSHALARMAALRAHLEYVRMTAAAKKCPEKDAVAGALKPLLKSAVLGDSLVAVTSSTGTIELHVPDWARFKSKDPKKTLPQIVWHIRCPL